MILQKTYCPDFRTKRQIVNHGQVPKYEVTNSHEAIIGLDEFNRVQQKLCRKGEKNNQPARSEPKLFTGLVKCGLCGSAYCRRNNGSGKYRHFIWTCRRYDELGKAVCPAQAVPEKILIEKTQEILATDTLTREVILERLNGIIVPGRNHLAYHFKDGTIREIEWQHRSRSERWTPEMRQVAREYALKHHRKEGNE